MTRTITKSFLVFQLFWLATSTTNGDISINKSTHQFPKDFKFGVSTSAYQNEGGWIEDGKGWSIWDYMTHIDPASIADRSNADVASDSYHLYKRDVEMLQELGVNSYKFTFAWSRILPNGLPTYINAKGIAYYNKLIDELLAKGIEPFAGIYHWDLPQNLQDKGGLLSDDFPTWFGDYARILFQHFGDRIKYWVTLNEPRAQCILVYQAGIHAPRTLLPVGVRPFKRQMNQSPETRYWKFGGSLSQGVFDCNRNQLLAHAKAYHIYDKEFRTTQKGKIAMNLLANWAMARSNSSEDAEAVLDFFTFTIGLFADPILSDKGNYPQRIIDRVAYMSSREGLNSSRLKPLTDEEVKYIRGTSDILTLNHYTTDLVFRNASTRESITNQSLTTLDNDQGLWTEKDPTWKRSTEPLVYEYAPGFYNILRYIQKSYNNPTIYILENGFITHRGLIDDVRVDCMRNYLGALLNAIESGVNVKGFFFWTLMDNFEWDVGYTVRNGLYEVDMNDPGRRRTARKSALVYKEIIRSRVIDYNYNPDPLIGHSGTSTIARQSLIGLASSVLILILCR